MLSEIIMAGDHKEIIDNEKDKSDDEILDKTEVEVKH